MGLLAPGSGFTGESNKLKVQILPLHPEYPWKDYCMLDCGDPQCQEWPDVITEPDPNNNGKQYYLCHVSECEMFDDPQDKRDPIL